jgi:hypothetical protein
MLTNKNVENDIENKSHRSSRHHSDNGSPNRRDDPTLSAPFLKTNIENSLSHRDFKPMHFNERNGTQLVLQMSGSGGLTTKRLKNNQQASNDSKS